MYFTTLNNDECRYSEFEDSNACDNLGFDSKWILNVEKYKKPNKDSMCGVKLSLDWNAPKTKLQEYLNGDLLDEMDNLYEKPVLQTQESPMRPAPEQDQKSKKPFEVREGDWTCPSCHNLNFSFRKKCNRCAVLKGAPDTPGQGDCGNKKKDKKNNHNAHGRKTQNDLNKANQRAYQMYCENGNVKTGNTSGVDMNMMYNNGMLNYNF